MNRLLQTCVLLAACVLAAMPASAQQILPDQFGRWQASPALTAGQTGPLSTLLLRETGESEEVSDYTLGPMLVRVRLQKYRDPSSAYEAYTAQLNVNMQPSTLGEASAVEPGNRFLKLLGNFVLEAGIPEEISERDLRTLIAAVESHAQKAPYPPIRSYLPEEGLVQGTQRYALGPAGFEAAAEALGRSAFAKLAPELGFSSGGEAMLARYWYGRGPGNVLLLVEYPTPQLAEQRLHHLQPILGSRPELAGTTVERKASLLSLVLAPSSAAYAVRLRDSINYETQVTWNEPSHTLTDPPWLVMVKNIFIGTMVFCVIAVVLGVAFGGVRVLTKRFFPGKVFDRPERMEVLQLGLSGRKIDPSDFY